MDDFKVVLGMEFLRRVNVIPLPYYGSMLLLEKGTSCMVPTSSGDSSTKIMSAMPLIKGVKKGETTHLAALQGDETVEPTMEPLPKIIDDALEANKDVMPPKLPKRLPPSRQAISHQKASDEIN